MAKSTRAKVEIDSLAYSCLAQFGRWGWRTSHDITGYEWCLPISHQPVSLCMVHSWYDSCRFLRLSRLSGRYPVTASCSSVLPSTNPSHLQETTGVADPKPFIKLFDNEPKQHFRFGAAGSYNQLYNWIGRMGCPFPKRTSIILYCTIYLIVSQISHFVSQLQRTGELCTALHPALCFVCGRPAARSEPPGRAKGSRDGWRLKLIASFFLCDCRSRVAWDL